MEFFNDDFSYPTFHLIQTPTEDITTSLDGLWCFSVTKIGSLPIIGCAYVVESQLQNTS